MNPIPTAQSIHEYEKLGIVGILLLVLVIGLILVTWFGKKVLKDGSKISEAHLEMSSKTIEVLSSLANKVENVKETVEQFHRRHDEMLSCPIKACPIKPTKLTHPKSFNPPDHNQNPSHA